MKRSMHARAVVNRYAVVKWHIICISHINKIIVHSIVRLHFITTPLVRK